MKLSSRIRLSTLREWSEINAHEYHSFQRESSESKRPDTTDNRTNQVTLQVRLRLTTEGIPKRESCILTDTAHIQCQSLLRKGHKFSYY